MPTKEKSSCARVLLRCPLLLLLRSGLDWPGTLRVVACGSACGAQGLPRKHSSKNYSDIKRQCNMNELPRSENHTHPRKKPDTSASLHAFIAGRSLIITMGRSLVNRWALALVALASSVRGEVLDVTAKVWIKHASIPVRTDGETALVCTWYTTRCSDTTASALVAVDSVYRRPARAHGCLHHRARWSPTPCCLARTAVRPSANVETREKCPLRGR